MTTLQDHYEAKYAAEAHAGPPPRVSRAARPRDRFTAALAAVAPRLPVQASLLELGAGDGRIGYSLLEERPDIARVVLSDFSEPRVQGLSRSFQDDPRVEVAQLDAEHVDYEEGSFDAILMVALIEHLLDPLRAMIRIRALLKPRGFVYIDTPNIAKWTRRLKLLRGEFPSTASMGEGLITYDGRPVDLYDEGHLHYFSYSSLSRMLIDRCGFSAVEPAPYAVAPLPVGPGHWAAKRLPGLFSDVAVIARV